MSPNFKAFIGGALAVFLFAAALDVADAEPVPEVVRIPLLTVDATSGVIAASTVKVPAGQNLLICFQVVGSEQVDPRNLECLRGASVLPSGAMLTEKVRLVLKTKVTA